MTYIFHHLDLDSYNHTSTERFKHSRKFHSEISADKVENEKHDRSSTQSTKVYLEWLN